MGERLGRGRGMDREAGERSETLQGGFSRGTGNGRGTGGSICTGGVGSEHEVMTG